MNVRVWIVSVPLRGSGDESRGWLILGSQAMVVVSVPLRGSGDESGDIVIGTLPLGLVSVPLRGSGDERLSQSVMKSKRLFCFSPLAGKW